MRQNKSRSPGAPLISRSALDGINGLLARATTEEEREAGIIPTVLAPGRVFEGHRIPKPDERSDSSPHVSFRMRSETPDDWIEMTSGIEIVFMFSDEERAELGDKWLHIVDGRFAFVDADPDKSE